MTRVYMTDVPMMLLARRTDAAGRLYEGTPFRSNDGSFIRIRVEKGRTYLYLPGCEVVIVPEGGTIMVKIEQGPS